MSSYPGLGATGQEYIQEEEYKALYGYPNGKVNSSLLAEVPGTSRPFILTNQLYSQTIPIPTPFDLGSTGPVIVGATTYGGSKQSSLSTPYLVRYNNVTLSNENLAQSGDGGALTYWFVGANFANAGSQALQVTYNILNQGIPTNLDPNAGYQAAVFVDGNAYNFGNAQYPWTYNVNSGIVLFTGSAVYPGSGSPFNNLPMASSAVTMTFWRYEGAIGAPGVWGITGNNIYNTNTGGNVGINTSNPVYTLDVHGDTTTLPNSGTLGVTDPYYSTITLNSVGGSATISQGAIGATSSALTIRNTTEGGYLYLGTTGGLMLMDNLGNISASANIAAPTVSVSTSATIGNSLATGLTFPLSVLGKSSQPPVAPATNFFTDIAIGINMGGGGGYNPNIMPGDNIIMWTDTGGSTGTNNVSSALVLSGKDNYGGIRIRPNGVSLNTPYNSAGATASDGLYVTGSVNITGSYLVNGAAPPSDSQWTSFSATSIGFSGNVNITATGASNVGLNLADDSSHSTNIYTYQANTYIVNNSSGLIYMYTGGGNPRLTILNDGRVGIATTAPSYTLDVNGTFWANSSIATGGTISASGTITAGSDYRIKEDIKPLQLEDYSVDNLNPVTFKFKKDGKESIGVIAHELQEYFPFLVEGEKDGEQTQTVNYNGLIGVLIKEIQELKGRVKELEKRI